MSDSSVEFASLLCSRLCHDLLSPVGAMNNGIELLADEQDPDMRERVIELLADSARASADRGTKILNYLADVTVNQPHGTRPSTVYAQDKLPDVDMEVAPPRGSKQQACQLDG